MEAIPDINPLDFALRVCAIRIDRIGNGLPCVLHSDPNRKAVYSKTAEDKPFNDFGQINVGQVCPLNYPNSDMETNQFRAKVFYELPPQTTLAAGKADVDEALIMKQISLPQALPRSMRG